MIIVVIISILTIILINFVIKNISIKLCWVNALLSKACSVTKTKIYLLRVQSFLMWVNQIFCLLLHHIFPRTDFFFLFHVKNLLRSMWLLGSLVNGKEIQERDLNAHENLSIWKTFLLNNCWLFVSILRLMITF